MLRGFWACCLLAAAFSAVALTSARAGDPAIEEPNGLFGAKLGYQQSGNGGGGSVLNGVFGPGGVFRQCTNNDCGSTSFGHSINTGGKGQQSGFAAYGGGQFATPLGHDFGAQLDGELGGFAGGGGGDATVHLFRGDPAVGLIGPMINYAALGDAGYLRAAAEGQYYWRDITLYGNAGYQWADSGTNLTLNNGIVGCGYVAYYPLDSLMLLAGGGGGAGEYGGFGEVEWQPFQHRDPSATLFVEGMAGADESAAAFAGFRYHFGAGNTLEMRHRHELPLRNTLCGMEQFVAPGSNIINIFVPE
jgi:hypothetical protein